MSSFSWRFLAWWVWIGSWSSLAPQVCKVWRQSHPNVYGPANIANESKLSGLDTALGDLGQPLSFGNATTRDVHCRKSKNNHLEKCEGTFHWRNWSKQFPQEPHNDSHLRYWRKSMQAVSKNLWRETGKDKMLERKSLVHKLVEFWITMTPQTSRKTNEALILYTNRFKSYLPHSGWQSAAFSAQCDLVIVWKSHFWTVWSGSFGRPPNHQNRISYI